MENFKEEILRRFKEHGWYNNELFDNGIEYGTGFLNVRVDYFTLTEKNNFKHKDGKINWTEQNSGEYEHWFFQIIEDIMIKHKLMRGNFKFIRHWKGR